MAGILENGTLITKFVAPMSVISNQPVFVSDTISLKRQVNSQGVQRWEISTRVEPTNSSADLLVHGIINGYNSVVDIQMPQPYRSLSNKTTTTSIPKVIGIVEEVAPEEFIYNPIPAGSSILLVENNNGTIAKGEFISFSNHDKVYLVTQNTVGNSELKIFPPLVTEVPDDTTIKYGNNVILKARYDTGTVLGMTYEDGILSDPGIIGFIEVL
jgi:hypothetical protein